MHPKTFCRWRVVVGFAALSLLISCGPADGTFRSENNSVGANANVSATTPIEVKKATGTVLSARLASPVGESLRVVYQVKLDDGTEVSAKPPQREKEVPTSIGSINSDDFGKKAELESLSGDEAKKALAAWKIVKIID